MIVSVLTLDRRSIKVLGICDAYAVHKLIYGMYPGDTRRFLYFDEEGDFRGRKILILSKNQPLLPDSGELTSKTITDGYLDYTRYAFQVKLNPVYRRNSQKTFIPVIGRAALEEWFLRRQSDWGFAVDPERLDISDISVQRIPKGSSQLFFNSAVFKGILTVQECEKFKNSFMNGIGKGKAFGFGLLQIRPLDTEE